MEPLYPNCTYKYVLGVFKQGVFAVDQ